jgi:hypothetical protein
MRTTSIWDCWLEPTDQDIELTMPPTCKSSTPLLSYQSPDLAVTCPTHRQKKPRRISQQADKSLTVDRPMFTGPNWLPAVSGTWCWTTNRVYPSWQHAGLSQFQSLRRVRRKESARRLERLTLSLSPAALSVTIRHCRWLPRLRTARNPRRA